MPTIIPIGGGEINRGDTLAIDKEIIKLSGKKHPKLLFIPTASTDSQKYIRAVHKYFGAKLGCKVDELLLIAQRPSLKEIKRKILDADIIYVGGGNTLKMMKLWRRLGVDKILKQALKKGIILTGISAGSICWFDSGHSDSMSFYNPKKWKYINVKALGFLKGVHCPHYNGRTLGVPRKKHFQDMMRKVGGMGIAIDNNCAIIFQDDKYRVITSKPKAKAYKVFKRKGKVISEDIPQNLKPEPIDNLYKR